MNDQEKRYAVRRLEDTAYAYKCEIASKHKKANTITPVTLSYEKRLALIRKGKVTLRPQKELKDLSTYHLNTISYVFDFSNFERKGQVKDWDKLQARLAKVDAHTLKVKDTIMLGDAPTALQMLESFSKELSKI